MRTAFLGIIFAVLVTTISITKLTENYFIFLDSISIMIVLGGTVAAAVTTFGIPDLFKIIKVIFKIFSRPMSDETTIIKQLIRISKDTYNNKHSLSNLAKDEAIHPFIRDGLRLIANDFEYEQIKVSMELSLESRRADHFHYVEILKTLSKYPPAFGMLGTVIGLISIMQGLNSDTGIDGMGPSMAVALVTTLYGLLISNYLFLPISDNLLHRLESMTRVRSIIIQGVLMIKENQDTIYLQEILISNISPSLRRNIIMENVG